MLLCLLVPGLLIHWLQLLDFFVISQLNVDFTFQFSLFLQYLPTFLLNFFKSVSVRYRLHENVTLKSSTAQRVFIYATPKMVTYLHENELGKCQKKSFQRLDDPTELSSKKNSWKLHFKRILWITIHNSCLKFLKLLRFQTHC